MVGIPLNTKFIRSKFKKKYRTQLNCFLDIVNFYDDLYCFLRRYLCGRGVYFIVIRMIALYLEADVIGAAFIFQYQIPILQVIRIAFIVGEMYDLAGNSTYKFEIYNRIYKARFSLTGVDYRSSTCFIEL